MGVPVEVWRSRIGSFNACQGSGSISVLYGLPFSSMVTSLHLFLVIFLMLVIGNVEINPGPLDISACAHCNFQADTAKQHMKHQQVHSMVFNFQFVCPFSVCQHKYSTYSSLSMHVSRHTTPRDQVVKDGAKFQCSYCDELINNNSEYCRHLKLKHFNSDREQEEIQCPLFSDEHSRCGFKCSVSAAFAVHLSRYHPGWGEDVGTEALSGVAIAPAGFGNDEFAFEDEGCAYGGDDEDQFHDSEDFSASGDDEYDSDASCNPEAFLRKTFDHDIIIQHLGNFYAMLEGKHIVPSSTVDAIASRLSFISELLQYKLKIDLKRILTSEGVDEKITSNVIRGVTSMDPLYNAHHVRAPGDCLLTSQRRETFYKTHFKHQDAVQINLNKNPQDKENTIHYVQVKETLRIMLEDSSVQKAVEKSFSSPPSDGTVLKDYKDGSVYRSSQTPEKCIDLFLFMDACNCTDPIGSAKNKHKMHFMYMALGNLKPHRRLLLKALRLVQIVNDKSFKVSEKMYKKCFRRVMNDLKSLESEGIDFKGERVAVRLQFFQGDNLGQHTIGGFLESFTGSHFCRFCELCKADFGAECQKAKPGVPSGPWRTPESFNQCLQEKKTSRVDHCKGIKRDSPLHTLDQFHVCEPRLPPCISHDLFINGVVDCDATSMIEKMIEKGWFTCHELNMRIKRFSYVENDARNKPAEFKEGKKKLGGHAIQNWTLFRLLPILVGHKVKTNDKVWKKYLLLKSILELCCAPELSAEQIESMRDLINKYLRKRKNLKNNYKPKHHFFSHYPDLFLKFGPLIYLWTMAMEHRHQYFKRVAQVCRNFINLGYTLAKKFQLLQAYQSMGELFPEGPIFKDTKPLEATGELLEFITGLKLAESAVEVQGLTLDEVKYKKGQWLLLGLNSDKVSIAKIELLVFDGLKCRAVVRKYEAEKWECYGLYYITDATPSLLDITLEQLENPCPHAVYDFKGRKCFSLKHVFLA